MLLVTSIVKKLLEHSMKKRCRRYTKWNLGLKKYLGEKAIDCMSNENAMIIHSITGLL